MMNELYRLLCGSRLQRDVKYRARRSRLLSRAFQGVQAGIVIGEGRTGSEDSREASSEGLHTSVDVEVISRPTRATHYLALLGKMPRLASGVGSY